jgi:hypothetical protein
MIVEDENARFFSCRLAVKMSRRQALMPPPTTIRS